MLWKCLCTIFNNGFGGQHINIKIIYYQHFYKLGFNILYHLQAIQEMSHSLPETEEEMLKIVGVTKANFEKYGRQLLEITQEAAANKFGKKNCNR